jgi:hypothetical protein
MSIFMEMPTGRKAGATPSPKPGDEKARHAPPSYLKCGISEDIAAVSLLMVRPRFCGTFPSVPTPIKIHRDADKINPKY